MLNGSNIYKDSCDFLYKKISSRAKKNKNKNPQLTNEQIYGSNPAIASNIINNKRTNNNPYLVPGRMVSHGDSKINQAEKIAENLGFYSLNDFLWGTKKEFMLYSGAFFNVLIQDALLYAEEKDIEIIQKALCFYAPYSRLHVYNRLKKNCYYKSLDFNYEDKDEPDDYYSAVARLYINIKNDFINEYIEYFYNKSTLKLNSTVSTFVSEKLIPIIEKYIETDNSFGKRCLTILELITNYMLDDNLANLPEEILTDDDKHEFEVYEKIVDESFCYFKKLEAFQQELEGDYEYWEILQDCWTENL